MSIEASVITPSWNLTKPRSQTSVSHYSNLPTGQHLYGLFKTVLLHFYDVYLFGMSPYITSGTKNSDFLKCVLEQFNDVEST